MYQVCDNNNTINIDYLGGLIDATPNREKFGLSGSDIGHMMESLDDGIIVDMNLSNWSGYMIFDAYIWYYNSHFWISWCLEYKFIKFANVCFFAFFYFSICRMKRKTTRKHINYSISRREFSTKGIKGRKNSI